MYRRIMRVPVKRFKYTEAYERDPTNHVKANTNYYGVVAQEIAHVFDYVVHKSDHAGIADFHSIRPELLYGEMIGAMQHMARRLRRLERVTSGKTI
jgi:hypothetical protein